jgi:hypothetical protein
MIRFSGDAPFPGVAAGNPIISVARADGAIKPPQHSYAMKRRRSDFKIITQ